METWAVVVVDLVTAILSFVAGFFSRMIYVSIKKNKTIVGDNNQNSGNICKSINEQTAGSGSVQTNIGGSVVGNISIGNIDD